MNPLRIIIVDDSLTYRTILKQVVRSLPNTDVVATATNGLDAINKIKALTQQQEPPIDLVLMDLQMPVMDGMQALQILNTEFKEISVVVISGFNQENAELTIKALETGAVDFIKKPDNAEAEQNFNELQYKLREITTSCQNKHRRHENFSTKPSKPSAKYGPGPLKAITAVAIGISTGGPAALMQMIPALPGNIPVPIFIVQHMPPYFTRSLADSLNIKAKLRVKEAEVGEVVKAGTIYIAPGGTHMVVESQDGQVVINTVDSPPENSCRPSVDVLFRSVAAVYGGHTLAVMMTGMGSDGALGMKLLKEKNAYCLSQTAESCVIYGMPRAVDEMNLPDEHVALEDLSQRISQLALNIRGNVA